MFVLKLKLCPFIYPENVYCPSGYRGRSKLFIRAVCVFCHYPIPAFFFFFCPITTVRVGSTQEGKYSSLLCSALGLNVPEMMEGI